ncbi:MAG: hypothetical protein M3R04_07440, partial [bacterium]|nr:hypothetical protein [bacterium]
LGILFGIFGFCALCGIIGKLNNKNSNSEVALKSDGSNSAATHSLLSRHRRQQRQNPLSPNFNSVAKRC